MTGVMAEEMVSVGTVVMALKAMAKRYAKADEGEKSMGCSLAAALLASDKPETAFLNLETLERMLHQELQDMRNDKANVAGEKLYDELSLLHEQMHRIVDDLELIPRLKKKSSSVE